MTTHPSPTRLLRVIVAAILSALFLGASPAFSAEPYPSRPLRLVVPYPAGGASDVLARLIAQRLADTLGRPLIVDNRPGAGTIIAYDIVAKAPADGYTILQCSDTLATNVTLIPKLPYDALRDFAPITRTGSLPLLIVANNALPAASLAELVSLARAKPRQVNYASFGVGSSSHLAGELFKSMARIDMVHVPYKGAPPALTDLVAGQVQIFFSGLPPGLPFVRGGRLKALAVTSLQRASQLPDVPTVAESGYPGYEAISWSGMLVPAGTPKPVVTRLHAEVTRILQVPALRETIIAQGFEPQSSTPDQFAAFLRSEMQKWGKVVREANIRLD